MKGKVFEMKKIFKIAFAVMVISALAGCYEDLLGFDDGDDIDWTGGTGGTSGGTNYSYTLQPEVYSCPSSCSLSYSNVNVQTASQCDGARVRYSDYQQNAYEYMRTGPRCETINGQTGCVNLTTLATLYTYYLEQSDLAKEVYNRLGCTG